MIELASRPARNSRILTQTVSDTRVLLNLDSGEYFSLGTVGDRVWSLCDGTLTVAEVIATVSGEFDAAADVIEADVLELLGDLARENLVLTDN